MVLKYFLICSILLAGTGPRVFAEGSVKRIASVEELARYASQSGNIVKMAPGVYKMSDYLKDSVVEKIRQSVPAGPGRPPVWMINFSGSNNRFDLSGVTLEIETELYPKLPRGYTRCLFISGNQNTFDGLTIRNTGPNQGSNGNILSIFGDGNTLENITLHVFGSQPYGYGDLLGKGGPNLVPLQKQSGIMVGGNDTLIRRCKVISRAFGHCFYVQGGVNTRLEDCYAEGVMRPTSEMLRDTSGPAFSRGFKSVYANRDGRYMITPGYMKSLAEDGFRTYSSGGPGNRPTGKMALINCVAVNTRAGFEIGGSEDGGVKTTLEGCVALGCERGYLLGSNVVVRRSRGDIVYGPLLYLRGGKDSDVELELTGGGSNYTVHALATIAGSNHRVQLTSTEYDRRSPLVPIMLGFRMPGAAEMSSPIGPLAASKIRLINEIAGVPVIQSDEATDVTIETKGPVLKDAETRTLQ